MSTLRIALWSAPRSLATPLLAAFASRGDCALWDEPFHAAWAEATGRPAPGGETDPDRVASAARGPAPGGWPLFVQKHRATHMEPGFDRRWMRTCRNVFLLRHPARVVASLARGRPGLEAGDLGFDRLEELFDEVAAWSGEMPPVVEAEALRAEPEAVLGALCARLGIAWSPRMLRWPPGPKPFEGPWGARSYAALRRSRGWEAEAGPLPPLGGRMAALAEAGMGAYGRMLEAAPRGAAPAVRTAR